MNQIVVTSRFSLLGMPGQVTVPIPRDPLASAPWIFVVYLAFQKAWPPAATLALIAVMTPIVVLTSRPRQVRA